MDPLTHTATGLFLSRIGLKRWTPLATPILLLAANAPDIDIVTAAGGSLNYLHYHRHLTHSIAAMPVMAIGTVALVWAFSGKQKIRWGGAFWAALIAVATHLLLDWTNVYGIRLLLPFSARWLRLDLLNIYDLWIWAVFLIAIAAPFLARLVGSEIASHDTGQPLHGRGFAWVALIFLVLYCGGRGVLHARAINELESRIYDDAAPVRTLAVPGPANPWNWKGVVETADFYAVDDVNLLGEFDPLRATIYRKPTPGPAIDAAARLPAFEEFLRFSQYPLWRVAPSAEIENGTTVQVLDLRFGTPQSPAFIVSATLDGNLHPIKSSFEFGLNRRR
ncbi:MAG TPA: metal-dependent hydrolase [Bryobacteraceae bacterium]|nr:metal-dependent hydrolase [Bryobacteraceae bacterium]